MMVVRLREILVVLCIVGCSSVENAKISADCNLVAPDLSVAPALDTSNADIRMIIETLTGYFEEGAESINSNAFWDTRDVERYMYPGSMLIGLRDGERGQDFYKIVFLGAKDVDEHTKLLKLAWSGYDVGRNVNIIRAVYSVYAVKRKDEWKLSRATDRLAVAWHQHEIGPVTYIVSPQRTFSRNDAEGFTDWMYKVSEYFEVEQFPVIYYDCKDPQEMYEILGFDFHPDGMVSSPKGTVEFGDIIYSGNNSSAYYHEAVHLYVKKLNPRANRLLDEGIAMLLGGSGPWPYSWHRENLSKWLTNNNVKLLDYTDPYAQAYIDGKTSIPYVTGALICEYIERDYGRRHILETIREGSPILDIVDEYKITSDKLLSLLRDNVSQSMPSWQGLSN